MRFPAILGALIIVSLAAAGGNPLDSPLEAGEADIWYLGHAGWLVRTSEHCLIFDHTGPIERGSLDNGTLSPELLANRKVVVFISHGHGDHFSKEVLRLRDSVKDLSVVMGWNEPGSGPAIVPEDGKWTDVSGAQVFALHHEYDGIPEGFFLVRSGGLTIYHSGDHGTWSDPPHETYRTNMDRMADAVDRIDLAFISAFGVRGGSGALNAGDVYGIKALEPGFTLPMHCGGREYLCVEFAKEVAARRLPTESVAAETPGQRFSHREGKLRWNPSSQSTSRDSTR